ncbi:MULTISPECIES: hypothetical protein [unclassified Marinovum]
MPMITVKYAKTDTRTGNLNYRRRVPKALQQFFPSQTMLVKALGKGGAAMVANGKYHEHIEHLLALAQAGVTGRTAAEQRSHLKAMLKGWSADPHSPGADANERTWRSEAADQMLAPFQDTDTGQWNAVPAEVEAQATALLKGIPETSPEPTITDAFRFYLVEKAMLIPEKRKKQIGPVAV